jgi:hypothetical protein
VTFGTVTVSPDPQPTATAATASPTDAPSRNLVIPARVSHTDDGLPQRLSGFASALDVWQAPRADTRHARAPGCPSRPASWEPPTIGHVELAREYEAEQEADRAARDRWRRDVGAASSATRAKGPRLLEQRLVSPVEPPVHLVRGNHDTYVVVGDPVYYCSCPASGACSHLLAEAAA